MKPKLIATAAALLVVLILMVSGNPFSYNDPTERTVVTQMDGKQFVQFKPGMFYAGLFAKEVSWPNQVSVSYADSKFDGDLHLTDNTVEIGTVKVRFNDATEAHVAGITQYILPNSEREMLEIHNAHRTPEGLVQRRLAPYTKECLQSSAQLLSSEAHYSGGRAQMVQDYLDQLKNGTYLLTVNETAIYDSLSGSTKRVYNVNKKQLTNGQYDRKFSSIKEYNILLGDAQITNTDYSEQVNNMLKQKIDAATQASVSKQRLMTAEQQRLTAKAEGERKLTEIEYIQKQEQTKQVVQAETQVELAKQDLAKQEIARQAAEKEAAKIKTLADAKAYEKQRIMAADGALDKKLDAYIKTQQYWADAMKGYTGALVPSVLYGGGGNGGGNGAVNFMEIMGLKAARDLSIDLKNKQ